MPETTCRICGKRVTLAQRADRGPVYLDPAVDVYAVFDGKHMTEATLTTLSMADHSAVCKG